MNNTIENSEDTSNPSTDKINNLHETVYLFKLLYPNKKHKNKNKTKKNKNELNDNKSKDNNQNILFKGFVNEFLLCGTKKSFYDNFTEIEFVSSSSNNNINLNSNNLNEKNYYDGFSENFINNNNLEKFEKSNLSNSINKKAVMPPKLNLNINFNIANKINSIGSVDDTSGSKRSINAATPNEENKNNNGNNNALNLPNKLNINLNKENNDILEKDDDDFLDEDDEDLDLIPYNDPLINKEKDKSCLKKIRIPKLMVSLQKNVLNEEKLTERAKIKSEQEENLNLLPESTLISTSQHIINKMNNLGMNKINLSGLNQINTNQNGNNVPNNKSNNPENENQEEIDIKALNEDYSLKDSERKKIISDYYSKHLSEVIPNFLYLSSYNATKNKSLLEKNKITHIINCAADFCENFFESENKYTYLSFYLKDHVLENIECIFYECIKFIDNVKEKGGRVLVHCIQGISRSVTLVMAYLIYKNKLTYDKAFNIVQSKREISSPNFGFSIQLQNFYLRLYEPASKFRYIPKIFAVGSFQNEQPEKIVCRLMNEPFFEHKENGIPRMLDKRGIFIIVSLNKVYLWLGSKISLTNKDIYLKTALDYINILKEYEHAPVDETGPIYMYDEKENEEFINELLTTKEKREMFKNKISDIFPEWNSWYKEIKIGGGKNNLKDKNNGGNLNDNNFDSKYNNGNNIEIKKGFFVYPNDKPDTVLDLDDLTDETYLVACVYQNNKPKIFLWKGKFVDINEKSLTEYKNKVKKYFFEEYKFREEELNKIVCVNEIPLEKSDEFLSFIQICY
jgi:protein-tyrosine phosphatase